MFPIVTRKPWGLAILILNFILPSSGTFIAAGNAEDKRLLVWGILQVLTSFILIGVLWSWITGIMIFARSEAPLEVAPDAAAA